jgi:4a-hydroxytetrahydrobiopterin dehydratase
VSDASSDAPRANPAEGVRLSPEQAYLALAQHPGWVVERSRIYRDYRFASFRAAMDFVDRVADLAESVAHHPNILVHEWCFVRLELYSHVSDCISQADVDFALATDDLRPG